VLNVHTGSWAELAEPWKAAFAAVASIIGWRRRSAPRAWMPTVSADWLRHYEQRSTRQISL
jgi:hypothetical protein